MACRCRPDTAARSAAACRLGRSVSSQAAARPSVGRPGIHPGGSPGGGWPWAAVVGGDQCPGVLTNQVMQEVAAARWLGEQVMVIQLTEQPPCGTEIGGDQRG